MLLLIRYFFRGDNDEFEGIVVVRFDYWMCKKVDLLVG